MSKYLDADNPVDMAAVEENYKKGVESAEKRAREQADRLLEEINEYRSKSFEELRADILERANSRGNPGLSSEEYFENLSEEQRNKIYMSYAKEFLWETKDSEFIDLSIEEQKNAQKEFVENMPEELKRSAVEKYRANDEKHTKQRIEECLKKDIIYDMMTEEQIDKYINLYYMHCLKENLHSARTHAIQNAANKLDKEYDFGNYEKIATIKTLEKDDERVKEEKKDTRKYIAKYFAGTSIGTLVTGGVGSLLGVLAADTAGVIVGGGLGIGITLAASGCVSINEFFQNKKGVKRAKELGLYDMFVESLKATKEYDEYKEYLEEEYLPEDLEEMIEESTKLIPEEESKEVSL
ncbi:MAG: hypothetical protein IJH34_15945 [Romboutsia sp.]|nr:hypothetical protein [Romboutsia sp.]